MSLHLHTLSVNAVQYEYANSVRSQAECRLTLHATWARLLQTSVVRGFIERHGRRKSHHQKRAAFILGHV